MQEKYFLNPYDKTEVCRWCRPDYSSARKHGDTGKFYRGVAVCNGKNALENAEKIVNALNKTESDDDTE